MDVTTALSLVFCPQWKSKAKKRIYVKFTICFVECLKAKLALRFFAVLFIMYSPPPFFFNSYILFSSNRQVNHEKELTLADVMSENITKDPVDLGVPHRLCLEDQVLYICEWIS